MTDRKWGSAVVDGAENLAGVLDPGQADADLDDPFSTFVSPSRAAARSGSRRPRRPVTPAPVRHPVPDEPPATTGSTGDTPVPEAPEGAVDDQKVNASRESPPEPAATGDDGVVEHAPADLVPADAQPPVQPTVRSSADPAASGGAGTRHRSTRPVVLQMAVPVVKATNEYARAHNVTKAEVVIHAVETSKDLFPTMFPTDFPEGTGSSLFAPRQVRRVRRVGEPLVQMQVQLLPAELAVLDRLVEQFRAPSRSQLVSKCLRAFLGLPDAPK